MSSISFEQALHGSPNDKGEYLKNLRFMHKNLEDVIDEVKRRMLPWSRPFSHHRRWTIRCR
jgi:hypothetical protein